MRIPTLQQRLSAKNRSQALLIGVTWYNAETWAQMKATAIDPHCFDRSFERWKVVAIKARREFQRSGVRAVECYIDPAEFFAWCELNQHENNAAARADFVSVKLSAAQEGLS